ncbi:hypothetical protein VPHD479_0233 [Vibrio phage D479]
MIILEWYGIIALAVLVIGFIQIAWYYREPYRRNGGKFPWYWDVYANIAIAILWLPYGILSISHWFTMREKRNARR